jgi:hypothetical protein
VESDDWFCSQENRAAVAREVGAALGMDEVVAEVLPAQKLEVVRAEQSAGHTVMMVGDGVNDAPALGGADVGVAIGAELNEVALGGADVALLGTDLRRLPRLIGLADATRRVIGPNVWLAFRRAHSTCRSWDFRPIDRRFVPERRGPYRRRQQRPNPRIRKTGKTLDSRPASGFKPLVASGGGAGLSWPFLPA